LTISATWLSVNRAEEEGADMVDQLR
jgi:hypothetical protein